VKLFHLTTLLFSPVLLCACGGETTTETLNNSAVIETEPQSALASVTSVVVTGQPGSYTFGVTVESPDTGCSQYADWWEVIRPDGSLIHRRILAHSHVDEQPFTRSSSPVNIASDDEIIVRAHMNNNGYGALVIRGSIEQGLFENSLETTFASDLETTAPLPDGCAF